MSDAISPNPYTAPASNLQEVLSDDQLPSIELALSRGYDFSIGAVLSESWQRVKGTKGLILGGLVVLFAALLIGSAALRAVLSFLVGMSHGMGGIYASTMFIALLTSALLYSLTAGISLIGIRRAADQPLSFGVMFKPLKRLLALIVTALIMLVLVNLGTFLLVIPGLYLGIAYMLAIPLVVERGLSPWQALEASRKAISQHWFKVFGLLLLLAVITALSAIPLGLGLIWSIPLCVVAMGVLYRTIFGVQPLA